MYTPASKALRILFKKDGISEGKLSNLTGITQPTIHRILTGESKEPRSKNIVALANYYGVSRDVFDTGIVDEESLGAVKRKEVIRPVSELSSDAVTISMMGAQLSMGFGISQDHLSHDEQVGSFETTKKWVNSRLSHATSIQNIKIITALGDSMKGTFNNGDALFIDTGVSEVKVDAIYALAYDGELFIKRVQRIPGGRLSLISDNAKGYKPITIEHKDVPTFLVIGRVIGVLNYNEL